MITIHVKGNNAINIYGKIEVTVNITYPKLKNQINTLNLGYVVNIVQVLGGKRLVEMVT